MRNSGIVDKDRDGAESFLCGVKGVCHGRAVGDVGLDRDRLAALAFNLVFQRLEPVRPPRYQRDRGAIVGQRPGKLHAEPARCAGHQRHAAFQAEHIGGFHAGALYTGDQRYGIDYEISRLLCARTFTGRMDCVKRLWQAAINSWNGLVAVTQSEAAFRQELLLLAVGIPLAFLLTDDVGSALR